LNSYEVDRGRWMSERNLDKAALRGEPSYVWRDGQQRRLEMILKAADSREKGVLLENGCGIGMYIEKLKPFGGEVHGLEYDYPRGLEAAENHENILCAAGEELPYPENFFDLILSHEVIEHVQNDKISIQEMVRTLKVGGRITLFCPNRWYPVETHGIYWKGKYKFGNIPFVNYLPRKLRDKLAPHVEVYTQKELGKLFNGLPVKFVEKKVIFGAYDNIIQRMPKFGKLIRKILQALEATPFQHFGVSHYWVVEKV
jgi:SAM-dependent methyltransferase